MGVLDPYKEHLGAIHDDPWAPEAACVGLDKLQILEGDDVNAAKRLCRNCPVIQQCGEKTFRLDPRADPDMVIAGLTKKERDAIRRGIQARRKPRAVKGKKHCTACDTTKDASDFYRHRGHADGLSSYCKTCHDADNHARRTAGKAA